MLRSTRLLSDGFFHNQNSNHQYPFNDLIALGSKSGDVMLRRTTWKMIWKTNIGMVPAVGTECKSDSPVTAMHFSPDGRFIAAATNKGLIHILDVECGKVRFSIKASDSSINKLQWDRVRDKSFSNKENENRASAESRYLEAVEGALEMANTIPGISREELGFVYQRLDEDGSTFKHDETQRDNLERTIIPDGVFYESFKYTVLLATLDSFVPKIAVLVAGVFPFMEIDVESVIKDFNQDCIIGYDSAHYNSAFRGISFVVTTMGPYLDCKHKQQEPPVIDPNRSGSTVQTLMFTVKLDLENSIWEVALRFLRLHFAYNLYSISLDTTKRNWTTQVEALHLLFDTKTKVVKIGDVLLEMLLSGSTDQAGEAFLERGLGTDGLEAIKAFSTKHLPEVGRLARGQLASAARNLCFQLSELEESMSRYRKNIDIEMDDSLLYAEEIPENESECPNGWINSLAKQIAILDAKTHLLGWNCSVMMQELNHLTKWISLTKPFAKTLKVTSLMKIKKMNIDKVVKYVVNNFIPDADTAREAEKRLFGLNQLISDRTKREKEENFDEIEYLDELEVAAKNTKKRELPFIKKFKFDALPSEEEQPALRLDPAEVAANIAIDEPLFEAAENQPPIDLDRVGSFFEDELSEKALAVIQKSDDEWDEFLGGVSGAFLNSPDVRKLGIKKSLSDLGNLLCSPQKINCDKAGNPNKVEVLFVHEICSDPRHQGYSDIKISDVTPGTFKEHQFNSIVGMGRAIQVSMIQRNTLNSIVIVPKRDITVELETSVTEHTVAMGRQYTFEHNIDVQGTGENQPPQAVEEEMETDQNELRIDVDLDPLQPEYDTLTEYHQIHPLRHGELVILGKFKARQDGTGILTRMMRSVASYPYATAQQKDVFAVNCPNDGKAEVSIETVIVHPTTELTAFLHDDGSKITLGDLKPEAPVFLEPEPVKPGTKKTFREYQQRREIYRRANNGSVNVNDVQYDVLVQEAMDSGRDLDAGEDDDDFDE